MKNVGGMWLPDSDTHFATKMATKGRYGQEDMIPHVLPYVRDRKTAFDIGAHVGYMTRAMLDYFDKVVAWEPIRQNCECFVKNVDMTRTYLSCCALGGRFGNISLTNPSAENSGAWTLSGPGEVLMDYLDRLVCWSLPCPDFVKIDVQGMERDVLSGAALLFTVTRPAILIEANDRNGVSELLEDWGAKMAWSRRRDQLWFWPEK